VSPEARNQLLFIAVVLVLLFVLVIRPARKRAQQVSKLQAALTVGDQVMLTSGIFGTVLTIDDEKARVQVDVADGVVLTVHRGAVAEIVRDIPTDLGDGDLGRVSGTDDDPVDNPVDGPAGKSDEATDRPSNPTSGPPDSPPSRGASTTASPETDATTSHDAGTRGAN
jgi:preprotein translocase subunit YajC